MRAEEVAAVVLDVAFADSAPQSLNIVNPQRARWSNVMLSIRDAILEQTSLDGDCLTIVPLVDWVVRLEKRAAGASSRDLDDIVSLSPIFSLTIPRGADTSLPFPLSSPLSRFSSFSVPWPAMRMSSPKHKVAGVSLRRAVSRISPRPRHRTLAMSCCICSPWAIWKRRLGYATGSPRDFSESLPMFRVLVMFRVVYYRLRC